MGLERCSDAFWFFAWYHAPKKGRYKTTNRINQGNFYSWVNYHDIELFSPDLVKLGRYIGIAQSVISAMMNWILKENGMIIP